MYIYFFVLFLCVLLSYWANKYQLRRVLFWLSALFVCFTGFRAYSVGIDTENYIQIWDEILMGKLTLVEPGYAWLNEFLQRFTDNPTILFLVCSAVIYPLIIYRLWDFRIIASFHVMIATFYMCDLMLSMNIIRQYMAVAIVFYFSRYLFRGNYIVYIIGVLLATTFHYSSLIALSLFAIELFRWNNLSKMNKAFIVAGFAAVPVASGLLLNFAISEYESYFLSISGSDMGLMTTFKAMFIILSCFIFNILKKNKYTSSNTYNLVIIVIIISLIGLLFESLEYFFPYMGRLGLIFHMFFLVFWGILYKMLYKDGIFIYTFFYLLLIVYPFISSIIYNGQGTIPFIFIF